MIWQKEEKRVRGGERLRRAVLVERQWIRERGTFPSILRWGIPSNFMGQRLVGRSPGRDRLIEVGLLFH